MHMRRSLLPCIVTITLFQGCTPLSKNIGDTLDDDDTETVGGESDGDSSGGHSSDGSGTPSTSGDGTTGTTAFPGSSDTEFEGTTEITSNSGTTAVSGDTQGSGDTTDGGTSGFYTFELHSWSGPCPPESDCDGFIGLRADRMLRLEPYGVIGDPVTEVEVSEEDYAAAVEVFSDPALMQIFQGPTPMCAPPNDILERMVLFYDGQAFDKSITGCQLPPLVAARDTMDALRVKYLP